MKTFHFIFILNFKEGENFSRGKGFSQPYRSHPWGGGCAHFIPFNGSKTRSHDKRFILRGGIYLASSVDYSCRAWNCGVSDEAVRRFVFLITSFADGVSSLGDIEHIRHTLPGEGEKLVVNQIYWITDRFVQ